MTDDMDDKPKVRRRPALVIEVRDMTNPDDNPALREAIAHVQPHKYRRASRTDFDPFQVFR